MVDEILPEKMSGTPLVSVVMNCYNSENYLREAIDSVYDQTWDNWEIVFWDNVSTDNSAEIAQSYDARLKYYLAEKNVPLYQARNLAINKCRGDYIAFLDCDDLWNKHKLHKQIRCFVENPDAAVVVTNARMRMLDVDSKCLYKNIEAIDKRTHHDLLRRYDIAMCTVMMRRETFNDNGGFDENFSITGDKELLVRLAFSNTILVMHDVLATVRIHPDSLSSAAFGQFSTENILLLVKLIVNKQEYYKENIIELDPLMKKIHFQMAIELWRKGESVEARKWLTSTVGLKHFMMYVITWLPSRVYGVFSRLYRFI